VPKLIDVLGAARARFGAQMPGVTGSGHLMGTLRFGTVPTASVCWLTGIPRYRESYAPEPRCSRPRGSTPRSRSRRSPPMSPRRSRFRGPRARTHLDSNWFNAQPRRSRDAMLWTGDRRRRCRRRASTYRP
jgi:hypothetical protein